MNVDQKLIKTKTEVMDGKLKMKMITEILEKLWRKRMLTDNSNKIK